MIFKFAIALTLLASCYLSVDGRSQNFTLDQSVQGLAKSNQEFAINLYKQLVKPRENLVVSGFSVSTILAMLLQGTRGNSAQELQTALQYGQLRSETLEDGFRKVLGAIKGDGNYSLNTANSIWIRENFQVLSQFQNKVRDVFLADAKVLKIATAKDEINKYVANKTENLIKELLKENPSEDTAAILLNAIFFKGTWTIQFENRTIEGGFLNNDDLVPADKRSPTTRMMQIERDVFRFVDSQELKAEIIELPYKGDEASMLILLPSQGTTLADLEETLTADGLRQAIKQMKPTNVSLVMPKFKIESDLDLVEPLVRLGVKEVFTDRADISGIAQNLKVTDVFQKAVIEVTQQGSKAAAASAVVIQTRMGRPRRPGVRLMRITHPFLFVIQHKPTNSVLFMGRYSQSAPFNKDEE